MKTITAIARPYMTSGESPGSLQDRQPLFMAS